MTAPLLKRLQESGETGLDLSPGCHLCLEAAVEITRLRGAPDSAAKIRADLDDRESAINRGRGKRIISANALLVRAQLLALEGQVLSTEETTSVAALRVTNDDMTLLARLLKAALPTMTEEREPWHAATRLLRKVQALR